MVEDEEKKIIEPVLTFRKDISDEKVKNLVIKIYKENAVSLNLTELTDKLKIELDNNTSKGWIVFAGKHMVGSCSYIKNTLMDFEVDGTSFVIFQTFCPE